MTTIKPASNAGSMSDAEIEVVAPAPFVQIPVWVLSCGPNCFAIYGSLMSFANNVTKSARPSVVRVARRAQVSESTAHRALKELERMGAIAITRVERTDGGSFVNRYDLRPAFDARMGGAADLVSRDVFDRGVSEGHPPLSEGHRGGVRGTPELDPEELEGVEEDGLDLPLGEVLPAAPVLLRASAGAREAPRLCDELRSAIIANGGRSYPVTKAWLDAARLLIDRDGVDPADVSHAIQWSTSHAFWAANILSMPKLREKYDTLRLQAQRDGNGTGTARQREYDDAMRSLDRMIQEAPA